MENGDIAEGKPIIPPKVCYIYDTRMMQHECISDFHPEQPLRISSIFTKLAEAGCIHRMVHIPCREALQEEVTLVHTQKLWDTVEGFQNISNDEILNQASYYELLSLYLNRNTPLAARLSCGGTIEAALAVAEGRCQRALAIVRPPGHHAEPREFMGFCFYNNVAVATKVVQARAPTKVLILDWDVHHGNGIHLAFEDDPSVLYISIHRYEGGTFYPCGELGGPKSCGKGAGLGFSVNIPWPDAGMRDADYLYVFHHVVMPIAMEFSPELVFVSAGFDAADGDDLGECHVTPAGLANGRVVVALEGGYNLDSISDSTLAVTKVLLGDPLPPLPPLSPSEEAVKTVWEVGMAQSQYWECMGPRIPVPKKGSTLSLDEILISHRAESLYTKHNIIQVNLPLREHCLIGGKLALSYAIVTFTPSTFSFISCRVTSNPTHLIMLVHEPPEVRAVVDPITCKVLLGSSYVVDVSQDIISWFAPSKVAFADVTVPLNPARILDDELDRDIAMYTWDNYLSLENPQHIILIGQGKGCDVIINLLGMRSASVMQKTRGVVQIANEGPVPTIPRNYPELRDWYSENSQVLVPIAQVDELESGRFANRQGAFVGIDGGNDLSTFVRSALPRIEEFIEAKLNGYSQ
ncbi:histone deacetylase clr3 [Thelephora terrestris]|uniref:histone deacetylase n=1 Tax=Thelephora terrestris TaxID=56493 RepID=A0A9P6HBA3_9AGAM|nr:histone deacetylase clr3 [Thelephora terrestris]